MPDDLGYPDDPVLRVTPDPGDPYALLHGSSDVRCYEPEGGDARVLVRGRGRRYMEGPLAPGSCHRVVLAQPGTVEVTVLRNSPDGPVLRIEALPSPAREGTDRA